VGLFYPDYVYGMGSVEILLANNYKGQLRILSHGKWAGVEQLRLFQHFSILLHSAVIPSEHFMSLNEWLSDKIWWG
jgi:hypothetical protein